MMAPINDGSYVQVVQMLGAIGEHRFKEQF
jgi:hypothetical protein